MLRVESLSKSFGDRLALDDLSFEIRAGEIYGLLGPNGAGKTTAINLLCGLLQPDRGRINFNGAPLSASSKPLIGIAPQETILYRSLTCAENLHFFAKLYGLHRLPRRQRVGDCLAAVGLSDRADTPVATLSGGMQRRLNVAVALVHQPQFVILDEPTVGLDIEARYELWALIRALQERGTTVLLTTHYLDEAERLCDRLNILRAGRSLAAGSLGQLRDRFVPAREVVLVQTDAPERAIARASELGYPHRRYGRDLALWLPESLDLSVLLARFAGIPLTSVARQPPNLEHIYLEVMQPGNSERSS